MTRLRKDLPFADGRGLWLAAAFLAAATILLFTNLASAQQSSAEGRFVAPALAVPLGEGPFMLSRDTVTSTATLVPADTATATSTATATVQRQDVDPVYITTVGPPSDGNQQAIVMPSSVTVSDDDPWFGPFYTVNDPDRVVGVDILNEHGYAIATTPSEGLCSLPEYIDSSFAIGYQTLATKGFYVRLCPGFEHLTEINLTVTTYPDSESYTTHRIRIISDSSATATNTPTTVPGDTVTSIATVVPADTATATSTATATLVPADTATATSTSTAVATVVPEDTATATSAATATLVPADTATATSTATATVQQRQDVDPVYITTVGPPSDGSQQAIAVPSSVTISDDDPWIGPFYAVNDPDRSVGIEILHERGFLTVSIFGKASPQDLCSVPGYIDSSFTITYQRAAESGFYIKRCPGFENLTEINLSVTTYPDSEGSTTHRITIISDSSATATNTPTAIPADTATSTSTGIATVVPADTATATPTTTSTATPTATATVTATMTATVAAATGPLVGFTVVDASTQPQGVLATLIDGGVLSLDDPTNGSYGIRVNTEPGVQIGSVRLQLTGAKSVDQTEGIPPYSLYGDNGDGALHGQALPVGEYILTATAYSQGNRGGDILETLAVSFTVAATSSTATATATLIPTDTATPTSTSTVTVVPADSATPESTATVTVVPTDTETATSSATPTVTATVAAATGPLVGFTVVDASTRPQASLATLIDGGVLTLADPTNGSYGIRVNTELGVQIGSVRLQLTGAKSVDQTEGIPPYSLYGDNGHGALHGQALPVGEYILTATAYSQVNRGGDILGTLAVSFTVEAASAPATATATLVPTDTATSTSTLTPTAVPADTATSTSTHTPTAVPADTATPTAIPTLTATMTATPTATVTPQPSATGTPTPDGFTTGGSGTHSDPYIIGNPSSVTAHSIRSYVASLTRLQVVYFLWYAEDRAGSWTVHIDTTPTSHDFDIFGRDEQGTAWDDTSRGLDGDEAITISVQSGGHILVGVQNFRGCAPTELTLTIEPPDQD